MSKEAVEAVIGKSVIDAEFRKLLLSDPQKALEGFELTDTEKAGLKSIGSETLEAMGNSLDTRSSKRRLF
jgi:hypothetical protein